MSASLATLIAVIAIAAAIVVRRPREARQRLALHTPVARPSTAGAWSSSTAALGVALAAALVVLHFAVPVAAVLGLMPAGVQWLRSRRHRGVDRAACEAAVVEVTFALAGELRAGRTQREALDAAALSAGPLRDVLAAAASSVAVGGSAAQELAEAARLPGAERLKSVAAAWAVTESAGGRVALVLERLGEAMDRDEELRREMQAALAAPRATMFVLAGLPLFGLLLGEGIGAHPISLLVHKPIGWALLAGAVILECVGVAASRFISKWALSG